jgi:hypothetical protein
MYEGSLCSDYQSSTEVRKYFRTVQLLSCEKKVRKYESTFVPSKVRKYEGIIMEARRYPVIDLLWIGPRHEPDSPRVVPSRDMANIQIDDILAGTPAIQCKTKVGPN